ncbi:MAG: C69 family dipeptidase [Lachnospiraceae bacterium]
MKKTSWNKAVKVVVAMITTVSLVLSGAQSALACCGFYVGSENTTNGSAYFGRSEDFGPANPKIFEVREAADHADGEMYTDAYGFSCPYPAHTLRFTVARDSLEKGEGGELGLGYGEVGMNEKGVAVSATVSTYDNSKVEAVDPLSYTGLCEISITTMILQEATTAKEGVQIIARLVDKYGAGECNAFFIGDANEVWYMEIVSGHQYVARKMPSDKASVVPNMMMTDQIDVTDSNIIASPELISTAKKGNFYYSETPENENSIHVAKSYSTGYAGHSSYRAWQGINYLNSEVAKNINPVPTEEYFSFLPNGEEKSAPGPFRLLFDMTEKISLKDALRFLSQRGVGTAYDSTADDTTAGVYPIGNKYQMECHVFEQKANMPADLTTVQWLAMGGSEFSVYIPSYANLITDTHESCKVESLTYTEDSLYWTFDSITSLCHANRAEVASVVTEYFSGVQDDIILQQGILENALVNYYNNGQKKTAAAWATKINAGMTEQVLDEAEYVLDSLEKYIAGGKKGTFALPGRDRFVKVTYNANGGSVEDGYTYVATGSAVEALAQPTRAGYTFAGWYTTPKGGKRIYTTTKTNADVTYYAHWKKVSVSKVTDVKLTAAKKAVKVSFNKVSSAKGYEIRYSTSSKMTSAKKVSATGTKTISGLKAGQKYYVQVRAYKLDSTGQKVYGSWSIVKSCKAK